MLQYLNNTLKLSVASMMHECLKRTFEAGVSYVIISLHTRGG